ncbi:MAG TPA: hypothetical protein VFV70_12815 [Hyphomonadaceae bacterium]|nr:hypothetical protein [Hyphomonadaceae bacterium]
MSEVVVQINADEAVDTSRLTKALDAFAKWSAEAGLASDSADAPDIMMMTEHSGGQMRRKLIFQTREHAARFLIFWRTERNVPSNDEPMAASA